METLDIENLRDLKRCTISAINKRLRIRDIGGYNDEKEPRWK